MIAAKQFIQTALQIELLPAEFTLEQTLDLVTQALQNSLDSRSDVDEVRITALRKALGTIESTTTDPVAALTAKRALVTDDD
ncbi:hypothetical protein ACSVIJ_04025 [Pseudomonas sp. NCHU5208]|uniref:hypothetical protein n=1 Tax=unclassified Pseudomonas TaxID=196821 RepID=UPI003F961F58